jgi:hypothetical protein
MPQFGIVTGACDPMECLLKRIGISNSEFKSPGTGGKVDYYWGDGEPLSGGSNPVPNALLGNSTQMLKEDMIMLPCDCGYEYYAEYGQPSWSNWGTGNYSTFQTNLQSYANKGGRIFASHWGRQWIEGGGVTPVPFPGVANWVAWWNDSGWDPPPSFEGQINTGFTQGSDFSTWMGIVGAQTSPSYFLVNASRYGTTSVIAPTQLWVNYTGRYTYDGSTYYSGTPNAPADFTFDTPLGGGTKYGRVMFTDMHLASGFNSGSFPSECPAGGLTPQEKAAEFLIFNLGACLTPPPPPKLVYFPATFTRDYQGVCPAGKVVVWRFFDWETVTPADSNIVFKAQEATTQPGLAGAMPVVTLGTASGAPITTWTGTDVSTLITPSLSYLRVTITLNPSSDGTQAPTLTAWRQQFDCVDGT